MSKGNLIAIAFSDLHAYKFSLFNKENSRLDWTLRALYSIADVADIHRVPLLFNGDLFHTPASVDNQTLLKTIIAYKEAIEDRKIAFFAIEGNHDMSEKNSLEHNSPSYLKTFNAIFNRFVLLGHNGDQPMPLNGFKFGQSNNYWVWGIPYMNNDRDLKKRIKQLKPIAENYKGYKILMLHNDCPGAVDDNGVEIEQCESMPRGKKKLEKFFKEWDLVLFGHIHKPQKLFKHGYMLGSPIHQISSDKSEMGYWKIFSDRAPQFVGLANFPRFRKLRKAERPDNTIDYFIPYEEVGKIEEVEKGDFDLSHSRTKLAKRYVKAKKIKDPKKKKALINILNAVE